MRQRILAHALTLTACLFLGFYYYFAWQNNALPRLSGLWQPIEFQIARPDHASVAFSFWHVDPKKETWSEHSVFNTRYLGSFGHILNYWQDIAPDSFSLGRKFPLRWYFQEGDESFMDGSVLTDVAHSYGSENRRFIERLRKRGVTCILLPIPPKALVERESMPAEWMRIRDPGAAYRLLVQADPAWTPDLLTRFAAYEREHPDEAIFRPLDHHWDSLGIALAASETLAILRKHGWQIPDQRVKFLRTLPDNDLNVEMNTREFLFLPASFLKNHAELSWNERLFDLEFKPQEKRAGRVLIFGSSYSTQLRQLGLSYGQLLARALGRTLVDATTDGSGFLNMLKQYVGKGLKFEPGDLVVIEYSMTSLVHWDQAKDFHDLD